MIRSDGSGSGPAGVFSHTNTHRRCFVGDFTDGEIRAEDESDAPALSTRADATEGRNHASHLGFRLAFHAIYETYNVIYEIDREQNDNNDNNNNNILNSFL